MNKKLVGILVCTLFITIATLPMVKPINIENNQVLEKDIQPIHPIKTFKFIGLPPFLLKLFNSDWDYWTNPPNMFTIPEGNIGIGVSNPASKLEVVGNVEAESFTINGVPVGTSTDSYWNIDEAGNITYNGDVSINGIICASVFSSLSSQYFDASSNPHPLYFDAPSGTHRACIDDITGNFGIGTTNPNARLDVEMEGIQPIGGAAEIGYWGNRATGDFAIAMGSNTLASGFASTAMGSGTTASGWQSTSMGAGTIASEVCSLAAGTKTTASGGGSVAIGTETTASGSNSMALGYGITVSGDNSIGIGLGYSSSTIVDDWVLSIMGGNVGIGKTSPTEMLDVDGTVKMTGFKMPTNAQDGYVLTSDSSGKGIWAPGGGGGAVGDVTGVIAGFGLIGGGWSGDIEINVDDGDGIDVTADQVLVDVTDIIGSGLREDNNDIGVFGLMAADGNPINAVYVDNDGNVGIGTTNPSEKLTIEGNAYIGGLNSGLLLGDDANSHPGGEWGIEYWDEYHGLNFWKPYGSPNWGNNYLFISDNGSVGIGTATPVKKLDVIGSIHCTSVDPAFISFSNESHESIRQYAKDVLESEEVMQFWNGAAHRLEIYVINEDAFYTLTGELIIE